MVKKNTPNFQRFNIRSFFCLVILFLLSFIFFYRLFFPELSVFITPEKGSSDLTNFNLPVKTFLSASLKNLQIPLWSKGIGSGIPLFAESQIGTFYLQNFILFRLFEPILAFNLGYILTFFIASSGFFFYSRYLKLSRMISLLTGIIFAYSGFFIGHIVHYNMIQAAALIPWIILSAHVLFEKKKTLFVLITSILLSQQIFVGHMQITFITLLLSSFLIFIHGKNIRLVLKNILLLIIVVLFSFLLSAVQILPTKELADLSIRSSGFSLQDNLFFRYPLTALMLFINPFIFGNVSQATYFSYNIESELFWENIGYIGFLPILISLTSLRLINKKLIRVLWIILSILFFLMLGKESPFYFIYSFFPFSYFRVSARFILGFIFILVVLCGFSLKNFENHVVKKKRKLLAKSIIFIIIIFTVVDIFGNWIFYHPVFSASKWLSYPEVASFLTKHKSEGRMLNLVRLDMSDWAKEYSKNGWKDKERYLYFRNDLNANSNLLWGVDQFRAYIAVLWTRRWNYYNSLISITNNIDQDYVTIDTASNKILNMSNIKYLISTISVKSDNVKLIYQTKQQNNLPTYKIYENISVLPRARMVYEYSNASSLIKIASIMQSPSFNPVKEAVLEKRLLGFSQNKDCKVINNCSNAINWTKNEDQFIELKVSTERDGLLVLADTYYPGWKAIIDDKETQILPANLDQRAIIVPKGTHSVKFIFQPQSFILGSRISLFFHFVTIGLLGYLCYSYFYRTRKV